MKTMDIDINEEEMNEAALDRAQLKEEVEYD